MLILNPRSLPLLDKIITILSYLQNMRNRLLFLIIWYTKKEVLSNTETKTKIRNSIRASANIHYQLTLLLPNCEKFTDNLTQVSH